MGCGPAKANNQELQFWFPLVYANANKAGVTSPNYFFLSLSAARHHLMRQGMARPLGKQVCPLQQASALILPARRVRFCRSGKPWLRLSAAKFAKLGSGSLSRDYGSLSCE